jgi:hypothetical protein
VAERQWVVVVEAEAANGDGSVEVGRLRRLLEVLPDLDPIALHSADRVAVQLHVDAPGEVEALAQALAELRAALPSVGLSEFQVIRAEVMTREELERECRVAYGGDTAASDGHEEGTAADPDGVAEQLLRQLFQDPLTRLPAPGFFMD